MYHEKYLIGKIYVVLWMLYLIDLEWAMDF